MAARGLAVALVLGLSTAGCSDPLGDRLAADPPDLDAPVETVDDGDPVASTTTTAVAPSSAPASDTVPAEPATTTTADPGVDAKAAWVDAVMAICAEEYAGLADAEVPEDADALVAHTRAVVAAYTRWADRVEALPIPDRRTEANLVEGLRRLRRSVDLLEPAVERAISGDVDGARAAWWSWGHSISGASTALYSAGVPVDCWT